MSLTIRRTRRLALLSLPLAALFLVPAAVAQGQDARPVATARPAAQQSGTPWLYRGSDVPQDKEWVFGELPNGLRYAVRKNGVPPGQVSIRVRVDVGSLNESESERGFAHLLEHLVFRESKYLGVSQAIPTWQRLGAAFGSDTNAETTPTGTTLKIDLPEATPGNLDESFKLLSGMVTAPVLSEGNVRTEVPIVLAEMRERSGAAARVADRMRETLYAGQLLAMRAPIGTVPTLEGARGASVQAFYDRWYRPENTVVIVAGDVDTATQAALVAKWFGGWKPAGTATPAPSFGDPVAPADAVETPGLVSAPVGQSKVLVEPDLSRGVSWAILRPWRQVDDTIPYNQGLMTDALAQQIINRRLEARARAGGSYLLASVNQQDVSRSADATFVSITPLGDNWQGAVKDVRAVIEDALETPPTQAEIDREVAEMSVAFASSVEQRSLLAGGKVADDLVQAIDIRETVAAPEDVQAIFRSSIPLFTPDSVLKHTRTLFSGTVTRAVLVTPKAAPGDTDTALRGALAATVLADNKARIDYKPIAFADLPAIGTPGPATFTSGSPIPQISQLAFANGVTAMVWPSADEPGRVTVKVRWGSGYRAFRPEDAAYIPLGDLALVGSGQGTLGQEELDRISTGRKMGFDFKIDDADFTLSADTRREDLADQLYLFAAKFAMPRWDANPVLRARAAARLQYDGFAVSPQSVLERDLKWLQHGRDPRYKTPTPAELDRVTPEGFRAAWAPILATGPIEVQVFGDIDQAQTVAALEKTFGALKPRPPLPPVAASLPAPTPSPVPVQLVHHGEPNTAAAMVSWPTGGGMAGIRESRQLEILTQLFTLRLMDRMREKTGASYAPQVFSTWPVDLASGGSIGALAQVKPEQVPLFYAAADEIAAGLATDPPSADELARVTEPLKQQITRAATSSAFFMYQLEGATSDRSRYTSLGTLLPDFSVTTPAAMQALAAKYLVKAKSWRLAVLPEGRAVAATKAAMPAKTGAQPAARAKKRR